jgi:tRNA pseudouridine55 synthase
MNGVAIIDKPAGWTSHDVVQKTRGLLREKKIGHTGTLDPLATGILVLCIGKATKIARYLEADDKEYIAELKLGTTTDTQDSTGRLLETVTYHPPTPDQVRAVLRQFEGDTLQRPPAYSALKVSGVPSYRLARSGTLMEHVEREVTIRKIELIEYRDPVVRFQVNCSKGTYVRTLCADIGKRLHTGAHLTSLRRIRAGQFGLDHASTMDGFSRAAVEGTAESLLIPLGEALGRLVEIAVDEADSRRLAHGCAVLLPAGIAQETFPFPVRVMGPARTLVAVGRVQNGMIRPETVVL